MSAELIQQLAKMREERTAGLAHIQEEYEETINGLIDVYRQDMCKMIKHAGYILCRDCDGTGAIERLDSGYMRKFRLREWDGCINCNGSKDIKGYGFVTKKENQ